MTAVLVSAVAVAACGPANDDGRRALEARIVALEQRASGTAPVPTTDTTQVRSDLQALERRLAVLEAEVIDLAGALADAGGGTAGAGGVHEPGNPRARRARPTREERQERRSELRALSTEYRDRLGEAQQQFSADPSDPGRQEAIREVLDWYRAERRAILRGE
jgi:hypothetical protein